MPIWVVFPLGIVAVAAALIVVWLMGGFALVKTNLGGVLRMQSKADWVIKDKGLPDGYIMNVVAVGTGAALLLFPIGLIFMFGWWLLSLIPGIASYPGLEGADWAYVGVVWGILNAFIGLKIGYDHGRKRS